MWGRNRSTTCRAMARGFGVAIEGSQSAPAMHKTCDATQPNVDYVLGVGPRLCERERFTDRQHSPRDLSFVQYVNKHSTITMDNAG